MTKILLIRHGHSEANKLDVFAGFYDADLENVGLLQAQAAADYIFQNYHIDRVYASDLKRAYKTGKVIADRFGVELISEPMFREISAGKWEGVHYWSLKERYPEDFNRWLTDIGNAGCTEGETLRQLSERVMTALEKVGRENDGKTIVIATHATPVRAIMTMIMHGELSKMQKVPWVSNASLTEIVYESGSFLLIRAGFDEYLNELKTSFENKE